MPTTPNRKNKGLALLRSIRLLVIKLYRLNDTPHKIAAGFGLGLFLGILPGVGVIAAVVLAIFLKVNRVSALIGALASNGWTSVLTFMAAVKTGALITGIRWQDLYAQCRAPFHDFHFKDLLAPPFWERMLSISFLKIMVPVFIGYLIVSLAIGLMAYAAAYFAVTRFRAMRSSKKLLLLLCVIGAGFNIPASLARAGTDIPINPMVELDYISSDEFSSLRTHYVREHPELAPEKYRPSPDVFGQVTGGKPWWGIEGLTYYGPGRRSIAGPSEESRFIANPYLLVGLDAGYAVVSSNQDAVPVVAYPQPLSLTWEGNTATAAYDIRGFWKGQVRANHPESTIKEHWISLIAYNARDLGYRYIAVDLTRSENILRTRSGESNVPVPLRQFIHTGGSCGYPGGCNNMSPMTPELDLLIFRAPARIMLKLWRDQPRDFNQKPDMDYCIQLQ